MLAQVDSADAVIKSATGHGWEAGLLVTIVLAIVGSFGYVLRRILADAECREARLAERVTRLEEQIRDEIFDQLKLSTEALSKVFVAVEKMCIAADRLQTAMERIETTLAARPCMLASIEHGKLISHMEEVLHGDSK